MRAKMRDTQVIDKPTTYVVSIRQGGECVFEGFPGAESTGKGRPERILSDREHGCSPLNDGSFGEEGSANIPEPQFLFVISAIRGMLPYMHNQWSRSSRSSDIDHPPGPFQVRGTSIHAHHYANTRIFQELPELISYISALGFPAFGFHGLAPCSRPLEAKAITTGLRLLQGFQLPAGPSQDDVLGGYLPSIHKNTYSIDPDELGAPHTSTGSEHASRPP